MHTIGKKYKCPACKDKKIINGTYACWCFTYAQQPNKKHRAFRENLAPYAATQPLEFATVIESILSKKPQEHLLVFLLNTKNVIMDCVTVSIGTVNSTMTTPRDIFRAAIAANATTIIMAHNHPSGVTTPSPEDIFVSKEIYQAGKLLRIDLLDCIIVGSHPNGFNEEYFSFSENNILY